MSQPKASPDDTERHESAENERVGQKLSAAAIMPSNSLTFYPIVRAPRSVGARTNVCLTYINEYEEKVVRRIADGSAMSRFLDTCERITAALDRRPQRDARAFPIQTSNN